MDRTVFGVLRGLRFVLGEISAGGLFNGESGVGLVTYFLTGDFLGRRFETDSDGLSVVVVVSEDET